MTVGGGGCWQVGGSVRTPGAWGCYAMEWPVNDFRERVFGRLGGVFRGSVVQFQPGQGFFIADGYWLPPDGEPIGPMAQMPSGHVLAIMNAFGASSSA